MKLNDMTIADIHSAAEKASQEYAPMYRKVAESTFREGACWAYDHLTKEGNGSAWCNQDLNDRSDCLITSDLLEKNGWKASVDRKQFFLGIEVNGITVYFQYITTNKALSYIDSIIPYPVERLSQIEDIFKVLHVDFKWEV